MIVLSALITVFRLAISFLPAPIQAFILGVLGLMLLVLVFKFVAFVLDSIPFL